MASWGNTVGTVFKTVQDTAGAASAVVTTVTDGVQMLHNYVQSATQDQQDRLKIHRAKFLDVLLEEEAQDVTERTLKIDRFCNQSERHKELYNSNYARLEALVRPQTSK